jgi:hypothetical protein
LGEPDREAAEKKIRQQIAGLMKRFDGVVRV